MKNEKFCFSKGTGLIALVGVLLVGFVLLTQVANQSTSTSTKAAPAAVFITGTDRLITCPATGTVSIWQQGSLYYKDSGVCSACADVSKSKSIASCQKCCNEPATQAEYLVAHPAPTAFDCMTADATTGRAKGYYSLSQNGKVCTGVGTKLVKGGTINQRCDNELNVVLSKCTTPTAITCTGTYTLSGNGKLCQGVGTKLFYGGTANQMCGNESSAPLSKCTAPTAITCTGTYTLSGNGKLCQGVGTKLFYGGTANQMCGNEASAPLSKCTGPTAINCMVADTTTGRAAGYYTFNGNNTVCTGVGTKAFKSGAPDQYCGNEASVDVSKCTAPTAMTCPPAGTKVYSDGGNACYLIDGKVVNSGTANQYCANLKMTDWKCCGNSTATGCQ